MAATSTPPIVVPAMNGCAAASEVKVERQEWAVRADGPQYEWATAEKGHCEPSLTAILRIVGCHQKIKTIIAYFESLSKRNASAAPAIIAPAVAPSDLRSSFDTTSKPSFLTN